MILQIVKPIWHSENQEGNLAKEVSNTMELSIGIIYQMKK